jgi:GNAT superfamily N-acetyltransferase
MALGDVEESMAVIDAAAAREPGVLDPSPASLAERAAIRRAHARFVNRDGPGAWVAVSDERVVGVAESIRRDGFWGLSMLFIHPNFQGLGVGRRLLDAALGYSTGAPVRMIQSSPDSRAIRRYAIAGLAMHPAVEVRGVPDRRAIPSALPGRHGNHEDLDLVAAVEAALGRSRTEDVAFTLEDANARLEVVDDGRRRGWILWRSGRLIMLGATDDDTAANLMWRYLAEVDGEALTSGLTAAQGWAFAVAHEAHLTVRVDGAMFVAGMNLPGPWIPSGWYF